MERSGNPDVDTCGARSDPDTSETMSNPDGYCGTPPTTSKASSGYNEKSGSYCSVYTPATTTAASDWGATTTNCDESYISQITRDAAITAIRRCSILPERPALWLVKGEKIALCPLAAAVLVNEGEVLAKDLELISPSDSVKRDPSDPLSGVVFATYDTVGDILSGLVAGPLEVAKQVTPMLARQNESKMNRSPVANDNVPWESVPLMAGDEYDAPSTSRAYTPPPSESDYSPSDDQTLPEEQSEPEHLNRPTQSSPNAAKEIALSTGKGLGSIVGAGLKAPMVFTNGVTRGFHNLPKLYGGEVRELENVTDLKSGLAVSAKGFGLGIADGLKDFFVQPVTGAQKEGALGFVKGFGKGLGNIVCKPAAGACGLVSYSFVGAYKQIQSLVPKGTGEIVSTQTLGQDECARSSADERASIVDRFKALIREADAGWKGWY